MEFDYRKLRGRMVEVCGSFAAAARSIGMSSANMSHRLNGRVEFSSTEIFNLMDKLKIDGHDIVTYFFTRRV